MAFAIIATLAPVVRAIPLSVSPDRTTYWVADTVRASGDTVCASQVANWVGGGAGAGAVGGALARGPDADGIHALSISAGRVNAKTGGSIHGLCALMLRSYHYFRGFPALRALRHGTSYWQVIDRKSRQATAGTRDGSYRDGAGKPRYSRLRWPQGLSNAPPCQPSAPGQTNNRDNRADRGFR